MLSQSLTNDNFRNEFTTYSRYISENLIYTIILATYETVSTTYSINVWELREYNYEKF